MLPLCCVSGRVCLNRVANFNIQLGRFTTHTMREQYLRAHGVATIPRHETTHITEAQAMGLRDADE